MNQEPPSPISRRQFVKRSALAAVCTALGRPVLAANPDAFRLDYIVASCLYGTMKLEEILPEVRTCRATHIDLWPKPHGNQREQMERLGHDRFVEMLRQHRVRAGILTRYDLGPFGLREEMAVARKLGARLVICHSRGPRNLSGPELRTEIGKFAESMKPHVAAAEEHGVVIGIENHSHSLVASPEAILRLMEEIESSHLGIALAPYHLDQDPSAIAGIIENLGDRLVHFYAWQHGKGSTKKLPKEEELLQMPGRGDLDFVPIVRALKKIDYAGWTSPFMHPVPRGIPILDTAAEVTAEIVRAQTYLEACLAKT